MLHLAIALLLTTAGNEPLPEPTPAQIRIERALRSVSEQPARAGAYTDLAFALARRGRETADPALYARASAAIDVSFALAPDNFAARRQQAWILLGQHRFEEALQVARRLNKEAPDDILVYGFLVDAYVELGRYGEAEEQCQWMLDMRPGNVPALTRAAYLRELFGDVGGAIDLMGQAFHAVDPNEREDRAWILTQIGHLQRSAGRLDAAGQVLQRALELFPDYHYSLAELGAVRLSEGRSAEALELLERRYTLAPHPENGRDLAEALEAAGQPQRAAELMLVFEQGARAESGAPDNANRELALHLARPASSAEDKAEALGLARREREQRADVVTRETLAWALFANGHAREARAEIEVVLRIGRRNADLLYRAGAIAAACGDQQAAREHLRAALDLRPLPAVADAARECLEALEAPSSKG